MTFDLRTSAGRVLQHKSLNHQRVIPLPQREIPLPLNQALHLSRQFLGVQLLQVPVLKMRAILLVTLLAASHAMDCNFDKGLCGWKNYPYNVINWARRRGRTPTANTGPDADHTSGKGYYVFMNARRGQRYDDAGLIYKGFTGSKCLTFWYCMRGSGIGSLDVYVDDRDVLFLEGSQGNCWKKAEVKITGKNSVIEFYAVRGKTKQGDIAIDDIRLTDVCGSSPPTQRPKPPTGHPTTPTGSPTPPKPSTPPVSPVPGGMCGMKGKSRIVGGQAAEQNEWPWQAFLMDKRKSQFCGGSLIAPQWVLTAAHCVQGESKKNVQVRLGAHKRKGEKPNGIVQDFKVVKIISHKKYNQRTMSNDVALLKLDREAKLSSHVNLVCLPESVSDPSHGQKCWTTGWGTLSSGGQAPNILHEVEVPAVSNDVCNKAYKGDIDGTMICAGLKEGGKDACQGDSGGPFVCGRGNGNNERFYLHGVTSWGHGCAAREKYGVYARVSVFTEWIRKGMGKPSKPRPSTAPPLSTSLPPVSLSVPSGGCGKGPNSRIVGGVEAKHGDYPWQALLQGAKSGRQFCGGTLVRSQWVVTAAHCVEGEKTKDIIVRMGAHDRVEGSPPHQSEQRFKLLKIISHSSYNDPLQMSHDIALLKLERRATLNAYTNLACLPSSNLTVGDHCVITGWGTLKSGGSQPARLQVATVPIVSQADCSKAYKNSIHDSMVCAGYPEGGKDSCQGDSGGPMVCRSAEGLYNLHGVTSWGYGCAAPGKPGVYARVTYLTDWINDQINRN